MQGKIKIKVGHIELEYEGDATFIDKGLTKLLEQVVAILPQTKTLMQPLDSSAPANSSGTGNSSLALEDSTNTIASNLHVKSASDLIIAAAAHLTFVKGQSKFTRKEVADQIKSATTFYTATQMTNFSKNLAALTKTKRLNLISADTYSLSATETKALEAKLAQ